MRRSLLALVLVVLALAIPAAATHDKVVPAHRWYPGGALSGGPYLDCPLCDLVGVRNIQGGKHTGRPRDLNLDIGAGSTVHPGDVTLNYDVGRRVLIYDGRKRLVAKFSGRGIVFYSKPRIVRQPGR